MRNAAPSQRCPGRPAGPLESRRRAAADTNLQLLCALLGRKPSLRRANGAPFLFGAFKSGGGWRLSQYVVLTVTRVKPLGQSVVSLRTWPEQLKKCKGSRRIFFLLLRAPSFHSFSRALTKPSGASWFRVTQMGDRGGVMGPEKGRGLRAKGKCVSG